MFHVLKSENPSLIRMGLTWKVEQELFDGTRRRIGFFACPAAAQRVADLLNEHATVVVAAEDEEETVGIGEIS
jgi:hypothetical protein